MNQDMSSFRQRMMSVAYRMLGSVVDAEDAVQDAFLRYQTASKVHAPEGFLIRTTTRLCLDRLRQRRRQSYIGPWVPEPVETRIAGQEAVLAESLSQAFLLLLERLTPNERAAFLLRIVFDYEYSEVADILGKSEPAIRQLVSRARERIGLADGRRVAVPLSQADLLAERFLDACRNGDLQTIESLMSETVEVHSDGGGKVTAARVVIQGRKRSAKFLCGVFRKLSRYCELRTTRVNGNPGVVFLSNGQVRDVLSINGHETIETVCITVNPDKLLRWSAIEVE